MPWHHWAVECEALVGGNGGFGNQYCADAFARRDDDTEWDRHRFSALGAQGRHDAAFAETGDVEKTRPTFTPDRSILHLLRGAPQADNGSHIGEQACLGE